MNIIVVSPSYPVLKKNSFPFVENLCNAFADLGHHVIVISPISITSWRNNRIKGVQRVVETYISEKGKVVLYSPRYVSLDRLPYIGHNISFKFISYCIDRCVNRIIENNGFKVDVIYGHFWWSGINSFKAANRKQIPLFVATGESVIPYSLTKVANFNRFKNYVKGVICVSTKNLNESVSLGFTTKDKCIVLPNAVNPQIFFLQDKYKLREKYGFPHDSFIVVFVGHFIHRKGPARVSEAIRLLGMDEIKAIYIGKEAHIDPEVPYGDNIIFKGELSPTILSEFLNCADVFVLPTLKEGCCNAIIEAMSCGLPIISSKRDFNEDVLDESNSILVDPLNISEIANAIKFIYSNKLVRDGMSKSSLIKSKLLTIHNRADKILNFIQTK